MAISKELANGIRRYEDEAAAIGYGSTVTCRMPDGSLRTGEFIELGFGGCQPGIRTPEGKRYGISPDEWRMLVESCGALRADEVES